MESEVAADIASGVGAGDYTDESGDCDRSPNAYSALWAARATGVPHRRLRSPDSITARSFHPMFRAAAAYAGAAGR